MQFVLCSILITPCSLFVFVFSTALLHAVCFVFNTALLHAVCFVFNTDYSMQFVCFVFSTALLHAVCLLVLFVQFCLLYKVCLLVHAVFSFPFLHV